MIKLLRQVESISKIMMLINHYPFSNKMSSWLFKQSCYYHHHRHQHDSRSRSIVRGYLSGFLSLWLIIQFASCQILVPLKSALSDCSNGIETFEKVTGVELGPGERIPLYSSTSGAITADCYNRCRASSSCSAFWIDYTSNSCFRLSSPKAIDGNFDVDFTKAAGYYERLCLQGDICAKAWVTERIPGYELAGHDDVIVRSVNSRKRCSELCLTDKRLPCRSADYWESRKECRLSREDRRTQPGAFLKSSKEVEYIENACVEPITAKERQCEWQLMRGFEFPIVDFTQKSPTLQECQKTCETYGAFTCRSISYDMVTGICSLSGSDMSTTSTKMLRSHENKVYAQRVPCIDMSLECNGETMIAKLKTHSPFYGKMYSSALSTDCEVFGHGKMTTTIEYPLSSCGVYKDADGSFVGNLIVQQHPLIQKRGDAAFRLVCTFPETNRTLTQTLGFEKESESRLVEASSAPGPVLGIATSVINATAKSPSVVLKILDRNGNDVSGVSLGDELYFVVEIEPNSAYGVLARDLIAKSGTNEEEITLLDGKGCPEDAAIFPHLKKWGHDGSKSLRGRFEAFKFTNDAVVRFQVYLQFCRNECPAVKCDGELSHGRRRRRRGVEKVIELQKEIIVSGPLETSSSVQKGKRLESVHQIENGRVVCIPKNLMFAAIIGFCLLQIVIVFACAVAVCQRGKERKFVGTSGVDAAAYRAGGGGSADMFYHHRPSNTSSIMNTLRSLHAFRE